MSWSMPEVRFARKSRCASAQINEELAQRLAAPEKLVFNVSPVIVRGQRQQQISRIGQESELYCPADTIKESLMTISMRDVDRLQLAMRSA